MANLNGTQVHQISARGWDGVGEQWSPDGSLLVYQQRDSSTNLLGNLFVQNLATGQRTRVTNLDQTQEWGWWFTFPSFSPDGKSILFQLPRGHLPSDDNRTWDLWSVPVAGGTPTLVQRKAGWGGYSPDGKWLAYLSPVRRDFTGAGLWITSVHGGTPHALVRHGSLGWLRWSPDGRRIAYSDGSAIYVVDAATGSTRKVGHGDNPEWLDDHTVILGSG
jgi:Tol biopolymer transport system component